MIKESKNPNNESSVDFIKTYENAKKISEKKLMVFDSLDQARKKLGIGKDFYYSQANLEGIPSPGGKTLGRT